LSAERERSNWRPLRRFIDALLRRARGRGLRTFTEKQWD
jgi:hypothetical protein